MRVQYIYDAEGRRTGVIVPIDLWYSLGIEKSVEKECGIREPEKYRGIYRSLKVDLKDELRKMRDEWDRL
ncbi:hypothetical protein E2N92_01320 [Methanofollis formosanus]|uniref:Uncharacterized protein n=2 Tax=Methanofollis formosanus TaxID=299308 RepID=A0A8G1EHU9_9EURY|nr:hypothetical protein [Methanofollis sp. W23]QYZ80357.1 hypothetical protein E2N92_01320 [Methanofollis formosanus]